MTNKFPQTIAGWLYRIIRSTPKQARAYCLLNCMVTGFCLWQLWDQMRSVARINAAVYQYVFPEALPSNAVRSLDTLKQVSINGSYCHIKDDVTRVLGEEGGWTGVYRALAWNLLPVNAFILLVDPLTVRTMGHFDNGGR